MIRVRKPISRANKAWLKRAEAESKLACAFFMKAANLTKKFSSPGFKAYGDKRLRKALNELYHYKCAYCEVDYGANQPVAIEHFRPKSRISDGGKYIRPGYYWLAADWTNLFPSCTDCNSRREQRVLWASQPPKVLVVGKGEVFPLAPNSARATKPGEEKNERPLLLNPAVDDPTKFITFVQIGGRAGVAATGNRSKPVVLAVPRDGGKRPRYPCGQTSIEVFALNRVGLANRRGSHADRLLGQLRHVKAALKTLDRNPNDRSAIVDLNSEIDDLIDAYMLDEHEFLAMTREIVLRECPSLKSKI